MSMCSGLGCSLNVWELGHYLLKAFSERNVTSRWGDFRSMFSQNSQVRGQDRKTLEYPESDKRNINGEPTNTFQTDNS